MSNGGNRVKKSETFEVEFDSDYPTNAQFCHHGPGIKLKVFKRKNEAKVECSYRWVCSFDRNGKCKLSKNKIQKSLGNVPRPKKINKKWENNFQTNRNDKTQGQYFFDKQTVDVFVQNIDKNSRNVLIGCPTLLVPLIEKGCKVTLLDIDHKFLSIFPREHFQLFNMINAHFFNELDEAFFRQFWDENDEESTDFNIIVDPPFGVMISVIMRTVELLRKSRKGKNYIFFPFFHDFRFAEFEMEMSDFKVCYKSHSKINRNKTVRIFVSGPLADFRLPKNNYKLCKKCAKYVDKSQFHCEKCDKCGDRSGRGVKHCNQCKQCTVRYVFTHFLTVYIFVILGRICIVSNVENVNQRNMNAKL